MSYRIPLLKDAPASTTGNTLRIRTSDPPYLVQATGSYAGANVIIEHTTESDVSEGASSAPSTYVQLGTIAPGGGTLEITHPLYKLRARTGTFSSGTATVMLVEHDAT